MTKRYILVEVETLHYASSALATAVKSALVWDGYTAGVRTADVTGYVDGVNLVGDGVSAPLLDLS